MAVRHMEKMKKENSKEVVVKGESDLELFYDEAATQLAKHPYCQNCGEFIPEKYFRHATAHIFPKKVNGGFPSIAAHYLNKLFLGAVFE